MRANIAVGNTPVKIASAGSWTKFLHITNAGAPGGLGTLIAVAYDSGASTVTCAGAAGGSAGTTVNTTDGTLLNPGQTLPLENVIQTQNNPTRNLFTLDVYAVSQIGVNNVIVVAQ